MGKFKTLYNEQKDPLTVRGMELLWKQFKDNVKKFGMKAGALIKKNKLSLDTDRDWLTKELKRITGQDWKLSGTDFIVASVYGGTRKKKDEEE